MRWSLAGLSARARARRVNDAPALAQADVGVAIGAGAAVAVEAADAVLVRSDDRIIAEAGAAGPRPAAQLRDVLVAVDLSRATYRRIRLNLLLALAYNTLAIPLAAGALYPLTHSTLRPEVAGLCMALSSVSVLLSSLELARYRPPLPGAAASAASAAAAAPRRPSPAAAAHLEFLTFAPPEEAGKEDERAALLPAAPRPAPPPPQPQPRRRPPPRRRRSLRRWPTGAASWWTRSCARTEDDGGYGDEDVEAPCLPHPAAAPRGRLGAGRAVCPFTGRPFELSQLRPVPPAEAMRRVLQQAAAARGPPPLLV
eukprot:tig00001628_g9429.t1